MKEQLPRPTESAREVASIAVAVLSDILPLGGNTLNEFWHQHLEERMRKAKNILVEEVQRRGISALSDEQLGYFIPASYQFFEKVRIGEGEYNLRILAKLISGEVLENHTDVNKFSRIANAISGLSRNELSLFIDATKAEFTHFPKDEGEVYTNARKIKSLNPTRYDGENDVIISSTLSFLATSGLIFQRNPVTLDEDLPAYRVTQLGMQVMEAAKQMGEEDA